MVGVSLRAILVCLAAFFGFSGTLLAQVNIGNESNVKDGFDVVALGVKGGIQDGNLSAFMIAPHGDSRSVLCDAGTVTNGIKVAIENGAFNDIVVPSKSSLSKVGYVSTHLINGYLITHAHLDHVAGLMIASVDDINKPIYGLPSTLTVLKNSLFNWQAWPNFTDGGKAPQLNKYALQAVNTNAVFPIKNTDMTAQAFELSHNGVISTAYLIRQGNSSMLCVGDTGPDVIEPGNQLATLWQAIADELIAGRLKAIIIEVSYVNARPDKLLFGHLTPKHLLVELSHLASLVGPASVNLTGELASGEKGGRSKYNALEDLPIVISHIKYSLKKEQNLAQVIEAELAERNTLGVKFIIPQQGERWHFY